jgi:AraC-like DNA-binding protein
MTSGEKDSLAHPSQVRAVAAELALTGPLTVGRIAAHLGISSRTLQRHLSGQDASLRAIVEECRLEIARVLLCKTDLSVQEIAARTGYSTPSGFARAFARWAGLPPRAYRRAGGRLDREMT